MKRKKIITNPNGIKVVISFSSSGDLTRREVDDAVNVFVDNVLTAMSEVPYYRIPLHKITVR